MCVSYRYATEARINDDGVGRRRVSNYRKRKLCDLHCLLARVEFVVKVVVVWKFGKIKKFVAARIITWHTSRVALLTN